MPNFFDAHSPFLGHPFLTPERSASEVEGLISLLELKPPDRVLDLGCGFGRHSVEFARHGMRVVGVDPSPTMIAAAAQRAAEAGVDGAEFTTNLADAEGPFDAAVAMFTTIGQVDNNGASNEHVLVEVAQRLGTGAPFVVEVPQRQAAVNQLVEHDEFGSGDNRTTITRTFEASSQRVHETFVVVADGVERTFDLAYRLFSRTELEHELATAGFEAVDVSADLVGTPLDDDHPTMIAVARRSA